MALGLIGLLFVHEMGHVLGLEHNFVASTFARGSVMDYFAPRIVLRADGTADLADAYMQGVGTYDKLAIEWGYSQGAPNASADDERTKQALFFVEPNRRQLCDIAAMLDAGQLRPVVGAVIPFAQAAMAFAREPVRNHRPGKTVVTLIPPG